uniref:Zinc carboxypeptidase n=1 Tax=Daphnia magna TaxID=35525 RepID=A0A0P6FVC1_9CRUS
MHLLPFAWLVLGCVFCFCQAAPTNDDDFVSYSEFQVWKITTRSNEENKLVLQMIRHYGFEAWKDSDAISAPIGVLIPPPFLEEMKLKLAATNISYEVEISDLQTAINDENASVNVSAITTKLAHKMDWTSYHRLDDIYGYLKYLADTYPKLVRLIDIGTSYEDRPLYVVRISNSSSPDTQPAVWIDLGIHAREWISPAVATYILHQLVEEPTNAGLLLNVDWYIMPIMNPDGYEYTHMKNRLWRKTRSKTSSKKCRGVDANRNFGYQWGGAGSSRDPCAIKFRGANAFSEPETLATSNFITEKSKQIKLYLTLHSFGQVFLLPWGHSVTYPSDYDEMKSLAKNATSKFKRYKYRVGNLAAVLYRASGNSADWAKSIGIDYSYTVELPAKDFLLPASRILPVSQDFFPALEVFAAKVATLKVTYSFPA